MRHLMIAIFLFLATATAQAAIFRSVSIAPAVLFDAPSQKARALFLYGPGVPLEEISSIEGWYRVRDLQGALGWMEKSVLGDQRWLQVRADNTPVYDQPDDRSPIVFEAAQDVLLLLDEEVPSPTMTAHPGWVRVLHKDDGQRGYIRIDRVFGL